MAEREEPRITYEQAIAFAATLGITKPRFVRLDGRRKSFPIRPRKHGLGRHRGRAPSTYAKREIEGRLQVIAAAPTPSKDELRWICWREGLSIRDQAYV